jgi:predicted ATP-dependent protease
MPSAPIHRGLILIDSSGSRSGQVNGLSVLQLGDVAFGQPSRITATARLGEGELVDIEREVELGGAIHSKGVMILSAYLASHYAPELPLSLRATLVFEQSYAGVDGDSAS